MNLWSHLSQKYLLAVLTGAEQTKQSCCTFSALLAAPGGCAAADFLATDWLAPEVLEMAPLSLVSITAPAESAESAEPCIFLM